MKKKTVHKLLYRISIILTIILAIITIAGAFVTKTPPESSTFLSFIGLILPVLLVMNTCMAIYWAIRLRLWVWFLLIAIGSNYSYISSMYQNPFKRNKLAHSQTTLKLATFNVGRFGGDNNGFNQRRIAFFMYEENVDVICMQEYKERGDVQADSLKVLFNSWPYSAIPQVEDKKNILQLAIYSRYPIVNSQLITYEDTPNCSMWCDILFNGKTIRVFNNHLQTTNINQSRSTYNTYYKNANELDTDIQFAVGTFSLYHANEIKRSVQARTIKNLINESPYPTIVCGDFNSTPSSYVYGTMKQDLKDGFRTAGRGYAGTYRYFKGLLRVDYIFHSPSIRGINYYTSKIDLGSDHNPVIMEIEI